MASEYNCIPFCQDSGASELMDFTVLWNFKDITKSSSEIQACWDLDVSSVGIFRTASETVSKAIRSSKANLEIN